LTGRKPFACKTPADTAEAVRRRIRRPSPKSIRRVRNREHVIHKAMAKGPSIASQSARDFGDTLQKAFNNQPIERFDSPRSSRASNGPRKRSRRRQRVRFRDFDRAGNRSHIDPEIALLRLKIDQATRQ